MRYRAAHVLIIGRRKTAVKFSGYGEEETRLGSEYEEIASVNDRITIVTQCYRFILTREYANSCKDARSNVTRIMAAKTWLRCQLF